MGDSRMQWIGGGEYSNYHNINILRNVTLFEF